MEKMDEKQSLQIISQMINTAKNNLGNNSFYFLLWGWAVFIAATTHYFLLINNSPLHYLPWPIFTIGAAIIATVHGYKEDKSRAVKTYLDKFFTALWIAIAIAIVLALALITHVADFRASYLAVMLLYGVGTTITGTVIKFKPLIIGGITIWLCAISILWLKFPEILLVLAFSVLAGYIIPGYMLRQQRERKK